MICSYRQDTHSQDTVIYNSRQENSSRQDTVINSFQIQISTTMATYYDATVACSQIHEFVQASGLHFIIKQTPWSSYITLRNKFVNSDNFVANRHSMASDLTTLLENKKLLENQVSKIELELLEGDEVYKKEKQKNEEAVQNIQCSL